MSNLTKATSEKNEHSNSFYHALKTKILEAEKKTINSIQNIQDTFLGKDAQLIAAKRAEIMSNLEEKYFEEAEIRRLLSRMSDEKTGLRLRKHSWKGAKGFTGAEAVDWLTNDIHSWSRHKASRFCQILMDQKAIVALKDSNPDNATNLELFQDKKTRGYTFTWFKTKKLKKKDNKKGDQPDMEEVPSGSKSQRDYPTQPTAESILRTRSESFDNGLKSSVTFPLGHVSHAKSVDKTGTPDRTDKVEHRRRSIDVDNNAKVPPVFVPSHHRSASIASTPHQNLKSPKHATILNTSAEDKTDSSNKRSNDREERQKKRASKSSKHVRVFKCFLDDDVRLLTVETKQLSVQYLIAQVTEEYNRERLVIKFMDEDGDLIRITKQQDLDYFLALYGHSKALKLFVFEDKGLVTSGTMYSPGLSQSSQHLNESKRSDDSGDSTDYELTDSVDILKPHSGNSVRLTNGSNGNTSSNSTNAYYVVETSKSLNNNLPTSGSAVIKQSNSVGPMTSPRDRLSNGSSSSYMWEIPKEQLSFGQVLGKGFFGEVRKGKWRGSDVAIKIIYRESFKEKNDEDLFIREVEILTKLRHPRVILFLGAVLSPECKAIVTEFMKGGSLYDLLHNPYQKQKHLPTNYQKLLTAIEIAQGMSYLHGIPILHRDLSCRNILMDEKYRAKVADFGLSKLKHDNKTISTTLGAVPWMSPEVIRGQVFTEKADVYSFGVVLWEMLTAKDPCPFDKTTLQLADMIAHHGYRPPVPEDCPIAWKKLMESCWSQEPEDRPDFNEILLSLEDMKRDPAFQRHRSVPNTPAAQMAKSDGDAIPVIHEGINSLNITSNASSTDKSPMSHSLQERIDYSSSSEGSDSDSDNPPQPKEKITSGYVD